MTRQHIRETEQAGGDPGGVHQMPRKDEQRDRQKRKALDVREGQLDNLVKRHLRMLEEKEYARDTDR